MSDDEPPELDPARTEALMTVLLLQVNNHYLASGGVSQTRVFEVLNALACATAMVIAGTAPFGVPDCLKFFSTAFTEQLDATLAAAGERVRPAPMH